MPSTDRDHRVGGEVRGPLHPARQPVAAAELVGLPRPPRLQRVRRDHVRDAVQQPGEQPRGVGVPGVASAPGRRRPAPPAISTSTPRACSAPLAWRSARRHRVPDRVGARTAEAVHLDLRPGRQRAQRGDEVLDVHAGAAVDVRRPLPGHHPDAHGVTLGAGARPHGTRATGAAATLRDMHGRSPGARHRPGRRRGQAARAADRGPRQAGGAVRRQLPADRLRALEPGERRDPADRRPHAVQEPQPGPAHHDRPGGCRQLLGNYVTPVPAQQRLGPRWYTGSADAIFQSLNLIYDERPDVVRRLRRRPRLPDGPARR